MRRDSLVIGETKEIEPSLLSRRRAIRIAVLMLSAGVCTAAFAELYKWTDDHGQVHYSDRAPNDRPSEDLSPRIGPRRASPPPPVYTQDPAVERWQEVWEERKPVLEERRREVREKRAARALEKRKLLCAKARAVVKLLEDNQNRFLFRRDAQTGHLLDAMSRHEIHTELENWNKIRKKNCRKGESRYPPPYHPFYADELPFWVDG